MMSCVKLRNYSFDTLNCLGFFVLAFYSCILRADEIEESKSLSLIPSSEIETLIEFAGQLKLVQVWGTESLEPEPSSIDSNSPKPPSELESSVAESKAPSVAESIPRAKSESVKVPIPTAQLSENENLKTLQSQTIGDEGGSPYGPNFGKVTFGKEGADNSLSGLLKDRGSIPVDRVEPAVKTPQVTEEMTQEQVLEIQESMDGLQEEMNKLAYQQEPFGTPDYKAYESAKELFKKNESLISKVKEFDYNFVKNANDLFVAHSWRDMDKVGKRPYEKFIENSKSKVVFQEPTGPGTKPEIHRAKRSH